MRMGIKDAFSSLSKGNRLHSLLEAERREVWANLVQFRRFSDKRTKSKRDLTARLEKADRLSREAQKLADEIAHFMTSSAQTLSGSQRAACGLAIPPLRVFATTLRNRVLKGTSARSRAEWNASFHLIFASELVKKRCTKYVDNDFAELLGLACPEIEDPVSVLSSRRARFKARFSDDYESLLCMVTEKVSSSLWCAISPKLESLRAREKALEEATRARAISAYASE